MPTTGNDTIHAGALITDIDGLAGNDLIYLNYANALPIGPAPIFYDINLIGGLQSRLYMWEQTTFSYSYHIFTISGFERLHFTGALNAQLRIRSGAGADTLLGSFLSDTIFGGSGGDLIYGRDGFDEIHVEGTGIDTIYAGDGGDVIYGVEYTDIVDGGTGNDRISVNISDSTAIDANLSQLVTSPTWTQIELIDLTLGAGNDTVRATELFGALHGGSGNDTLFLNRTGLSAVNVSTLAALHSGFEQISFQGSSYNDRIAATAGNDTIYGGQGNDDFWGLAGNDSMFGGDGNDQFLGVNFGDTIHGGAGLDFALVDLSNASSGATLGEGRDWGGITSIEVVLGGLTRHNDVYHGGENLINFSSNSLLPYAPTLNAGFGVDTFVADFSSIGGGIFDRFSLQSSGQIFADLSFKIVSSAKSALVSLFYFENFDIIGTNGGDRIECAAGNDTIAGLNGDDLISLGDGNDIGYGGGGMDILVGESGADSLFGGESDDQLLGNEGADSLRGGTGNDGFVLDTLDVAYGEEGNDRFSLSEIGAHVFGGAGFDTVQLSLTSVSQGVSFSTRNGVSGVHDIEAITGYMTAFNDDIFVNLASFSIDGYFGTDTLVLDFTDPLRFARISTSAVGAGVHLNVFTTNGGAAIASSARDFEIIQIFGTAGDDQITSLSGTHTLHGGLGDDSLATGSGNDFIFGGGGNDEVGGGEGADWLFTGDGNDVLRGASGDDRLYGQAGEDTLWGSYGNDSLFGDVGNDHLFGQEDNDILNGQAGNDTLYGDTGNDWMQGDIGEDELYGGDGNETIHGGGDDDFIQADAGLDVIYAGDGIDFIDGGAGNDWSFGGAGPDLFFFDGVLASGRDIINDFSTVEDALWISGRLTRGAVTVVSSGTNLIVSWAGGEVTLVGRAGATPTILFDADLL